jgi:PAS domain S-box-containing protein
VRWISHGCRRIFDEEGHFLGIRGSNRDVTARKQVEGTIKADLEALTRMHTLSGRLLEQGGLQPLLEEVMDSAVAIMGAEKGTLQLFEKGSLRIVAQHGHQQPFLDFFSAAENVASVCGETTRRGGRVIVPDVETSSLFVGTPSLEVLRKAGVRAVQSTPMISRTGTLVGILTTQWGVPYSPNEHDLWRVDLLMRQAVELIEYSRAEEELRVSEARRKVAEAVEAERKRLYDVLETLPAMVCLMTPDYHVTFANRSFREKFGDSGGRHCYEYCFGRAQPCEFCESYNVLKTGKPHHWEVTAPDGLGIFDAYDFPFADVDGSPLILEMDIDITEHKRAEEALRDASRYTRNLIEASLDPLVTISAEGKIMDVNRATEQITGISRDQLIGTDFLDYFTEPEKAREGYQKVFREGLVKDYPLAIRHTSGRVIDVLYNAVVYKNEAGDVQGVFAAARDVTDLKQKESQIRFFASQCLTAQETERRRIAAELHDSIVASLAAAKFRVETLMQQIKQGGGSLGSMNDIASTIGKIINDIRRIMADLRPSVLDDLGVIPAITWFCREFQQTYSHLSVEKHIGTEEHEVPDSLKTPIFRIAQEAMNNVAKHSKASLVNLLLQKEGERILLSVQDNGQGFDPERVKKGMGLSNIRERAELSGGVCELRSTMGKGTTVRVWWPIQVENVA